MVNGARRPLPPPKNSPYTPWPPPPPLSWKNPPPLDFQVNPPLPPRRRGGGGGARGWGGGGRPHLTRKRAPFSAKTPFQQKLSRSVIISHQMVFCQGPKDSAFGKPCLCPAENTRERKANTNCFFLGRLRDIPAKSRDIPPKSFVSLFRGTYRTFQPQPLHVENPHPTGGYPDPKAWVWVPFSSLKKERGF